MRLLSERLTEVRCIGFSERGKDADRVGETECIDHLGD